MLKVLIVGGGIAGLASAKALQNLGIAFDIIEKEECIRSEGAGIAIPANGSFALSQIGIDLRSKALLIDKMQFTDDQGEVLIEERIDKIHPEGAQFYSLSRDALIRELRSHVDQEIMSKTTLKSFVEESDRVEVEFSTSKIASYDLVIGCDGIYSQLRKQAHPEETPQFLGLLVWRTLIEESSQIPMPTYMLGRDRSLLLYPLPQGKTYVYGQLFQTEKKESLEPFSAVFSTFGGQVKQALQTCTRTKPHFYIHHMEKSHSVRYRVDGFSRILLIGDAAHAFGPMLQNGAAQAFEDAYVLQELLSTCHDIPVLIAQFEKRRLHRVQTIFDMSNVRIQALSDPAQIQGRNEMIRKQGAPNVNGFKLIMREKP